MLFQVPSGVFIESFGSRWICSLALFLSFLLNVATPFMTDFTLYNLPILLIISRVILGAAQAGVFPGCFKLCFNWFSLSERSLAYSLLRVGSIAGVVVISFVTGFIITSLGWEAVFYISSVLGLVSCVAFAFLVTDRPEHHPFISSEEIVSLRESKEQETSGKGAEKSSPTPWFKILTNIPVLTNGLFKFSYFWIIFLILSKLPTYLADVMKMDIRFNGMTNAIFSLSFGVSLSLTGFLSDRIIESGFFARTITRKIFVAVAGFGSGVCVMLIPIVGSSIPLLILLLIVSSLCSGFSSGGDVPLPGEMSKKYPATIFSLVNMMSMISGSVAPMTVGFILKRSSDVRVSWIFIFTGSGIFSIACTTIFIFFASAQRQPFDLDNPSQTIEVENNKKEEH
jgi:sugar phosphate permease